MFQIQSKPKVGREKKVNGRNEGRVAVPLQNAGLAEFDFLLNLKLLNGGFKYL